MRQIGPEIGTISRMIRQAALLFFEKEAMEEDSINKTKKRLVHVIIIHIIVIILKEYASRKMANNYCCHYKIIY